MASGSGGGGGRRVNNKWSCVRWLMDSCNRGYGGDGGCNDI